MFCLLLLTTLVEAQPCLSSLPFLHRLKTIKDYALHKPCKRVESSVYEGEWRSGAPAIHPLELLQPGKKANQMHYKVLLNEQGYVLEAWHYEGTVLAYHYQWFPEKQKVVIEMLNQQGNKTLTEQIYFSDAYPKEAVVKDEHGEVERYVYHYDEQQRLKTIQVWRKNKAIAYYRCFYDVDGNLVRLETYEKGQLKSLCQCVYDEQHRIKEVAQDLWKRQFFYDSTGRLTKTIDYHKDRIIVEKHWLYLQDLLLDLEQPTYSASRYEQLRAANQETLIITEIKGDRKRFYAYNRFGDLLRVVEEGTGGKQRSLKSYFYFYDAHGNWYHRAEEIQGHYFITKRQLDY